MFCLTKGDSLPGVFVPESDDVAELVDDNAELLPML
jgi:hypothetical protein